MDYGKVLSRAWEITWRWKILWILGFLASLGQGGGGTGINYTTSSSDWQDWQGWQIDPDFAGAVLAAIVALSCVAILIGIALWVASVIARGGLIAGVQQVEDEGSTSFGRAWRVGVKRFWTLLGIGILAALPLILLGLVAVVMMVLWLVPVTSSTELSSWTAALGVLGIGCGGLFCCGAIILSLLLGLIRTYAERAAVLEGLGWIEAFKRGWQVLKTNIGPTLVFWLVFMAIGIVIAGVVFAGVAATTLPFIGLFTQTDVGGWIVAPICCGGLVAMVLAALIGSLVNTFTSATWTLAYREMVRRTDQPAAVVQPIES
jgi:hypothetical protein